MMILPIPSAVACDRNCCMNFLVWWVHAAEGDSTDALKQEVISYYITTTSCYRDDALSFWKDNQSHFPILSEMAALYLVTSASSVPVESLFSTTGLVLNSRHSSL